MFGDDGSGDDHFIPPTRGGAAHLALYRPEDVESVASIEIDADEVDAVGEQSGFFEVPLNIVTPRVQYL